MGKLERKRAGGSRGRRSGEREKAIAWKPVGEGKSNSRWLGKSADAAFRGFRADLQAPPSLVFDRQSNTRAGRPCVSEWLLGRLLTGRRPGRHWSGRGTGTPGGYPPRWVRRGSWDSASSSSDAQPLPLPICAPMRIHTHDWVRLSLPGLPHPPQIPLSLSPKPHGTPLTQTENSTVWGIRA